MKSFEEASRIIEEEFNKITLDIEPVKLENALHRTLAEDVVADVDLPPFDNSAMDGIAVKFNEQIKEWNVIGEIPAGKYQEYELDEHSAVKIMTGSRLPGFCDTVIPVEDIDVNNSTAVLKENVRYVKGMNIRKQASDLKKGEVSISKNTYLLPRHLATAASCGKDNLLVYKPLTFAVLATGDELIPVNEVPVGDKIRISNTYSLLASVEEINMKAVNLGIVKDDKNILLEKIDNALKSDIDVLITTGGVSVGEFDFVKDVFEGLGVDVKFWKAFIKPGKPIVFGVHEKDKKKKLVFGLPGNPVSSLVNFEIFVHDNINRLYNQPLRERVKAVLMNDLKKKDNKRHFMRGILSVNDKGEYEVSSKFSQSSGNLVEMSRANCLIVIEEGIHNPVKGTVVKCIKM